jgi:DNA primase
MKIEKPELKIDKNLYCLTDYLVKTIDLCDFIENETGQALKWSGSSNRAKCHCPMPDHHDTNASFHIKKLDDGGAIFHCFGCGRKGTIIHFCLDYFCLRNKLEAIAYLCNRFDIKDKEDLILSSYKNIKKTINMERKMENANLVASNICRILLRKDFLKHKSWVADTYKKLNVALEEEDYETVENLGYEASKRINYKGEVL